MACHPDEGGICLAIVLKLGSCLLRRHDITTHSAANKASCTKNPRDSPGAFLFI